MKGALGKEDRMTLETADGGFKDLTLDTETTAAIDFGLEAVIMFKVGAGAGETGGFGLL
jgi:hypothetical protein